MATDTDNDGTSIYSTPKGGLYGGPLDPAGLDPNVQATLMGFRWTTSFEGSQPATTIHYSFPTSVRELQRPSPATRPPQSSTPSSR